MAVPSFNINPGETAEDLAFRRKMAMQMLQSGMDGGEVKHWAQGAGKLAQALVGGMIMRNASEEAKANEAAGAKSLAELLARPEGAADPSTVPAAGVPGSPVPPAAPPATVAPPATRPMPAPGSPNARVAEGFDAMAPGPTPNARVARGFAALDPSTPRGIRNNNPLNIEAGRFTEGMPGYAGTDGRFARFETPDQGVAAADRLLNIYRDKHGLNTVAGIVGRWAPSADGNNVSAYASSVAQQLGIGPDDPIPPEMRPKLIAAMGQHENGRPITMALASPEAASGAPAAGSPPAVAAATPPAPVPAGPAAAPRAAQPDMRARTIALLNSGTPQARALGKQLGMMILQQDVTPSGHKFIVAGDQLYRTNERTGAAEPVAAASKPIPLGKDQRLVDPKTNKELVGSEADRIEKIDLGDGRTVSAQRNPDGSYRVVNVQGSNAIAPKLSEGERDEIIKADDAVTSGRAALDAIDEARKLNKKAFSGAFAEERAWLARNNLLGIGKESGAATTQMNTLVSEQALNSLKAIFGGNPTEGERKILLDLQASVSKSPEEREAILERAQKAAERRIALQEQRGKSIRSGEYYKPGFTPGLANLPGGTASATAPDPLGIR